MQRSSEAGIALVAALMTMVLMMALGGALVLITSSETRIAANFRAGQQAFYAADAILERAMSDLRAVPDWTSVLDGSLRSSFADGAVDGIRTLPDGTTIDPAQIANVASCGKSSACTDAEVAAQTQGRPWGANNPRWTPYAYGRLADLAGSLDTLFYVVAMVGDDPSENDADPRRDGAIVGEWPNPGRGIISLRAEAFGLRRAHKIVEATIARMSGGDPPVADTELRILSWREVR